MKKFNVIIENNGRFEPHDIMPYLKDSWKDFVKSHEKMIKAPSEYGIDSYWHLPKNFKEIRNWVERTLRYRYWSRTEYEIILSQWPCRENEKGEVIIPKGEGKKIDIYEQCEMNMDTITRLFIEEVYF